MQLVQVMNFATPKTLDTLSIDSSAAIQTQPRTGLGQSNTLGTMSGSDVNMTRIHFPLCQNDVCCASWEVDLDPWWQQNPMWRVSDENATHFCFSKLPSNSTTDLKRIAFFEALHQVQWHGNCSNVHARTQVNSGLAASLNFLHTAFVTAWGTKRPFQVTIQHEDFAWIYATYKNKTGVCLTRDVRCYFLPVSNCQARISQNDGRNGIYNKFTKKFQGRWIREYFTRPRQWLRLSLLQYRESPSFPKLKTPCSVIHVRRTDVTLEESWFQKRNYFPIADYVEHLQPGSNVLLMTDDQSAVDEALRFHPNYTWYFIKRARHYGTSGGLERHLPSHDPLLEMLIILSELRLASFCTKLIHTRSGFVDLIREAMESSQGQIEIIQIDHGKQPNQTSWESANEFFHKLNISNAANVYP